MNRRDFVRFLGLGLAGACAGGQVYWPREAAAAPALRLAFLADAHLKDGDARRPEAQALARAVAELRGLNPAPQLVLFAGDLAHHGNPAALALGREILADLPASCLMLMGEGDGQPDDAAPWRRLFGEPWFISDSAGTASASGCILPGAPAPAARSFGWATPAAAGWPVNWTASTPKFPSCSFPTPRWTRSSGPGSNGPWTARRCSPSCAAFARSSASTATRIRQWPVVSGQWPVKAMTLARFCLLKTGKPQTENLPSALSLPATAWPQPQAIQGTPARLGPGLGPSGCGWALLAAEAGSFKLQPQVWEA